MTSVSAAFLALVYGGAATAATAPPLGSTSSYGVAASTFSNTNATTSVNGNVCFTTGPGTAYSLTGTQTVPCTTQVADQNAALADLNGQACTPIGAAVALEAIDIDGAGPTPAGTFVPGCYSTTGAMSITTGTTVTLSGAGVYIFRTSSGGLQPATNSAIALTAGASASQVFWAPSAATTFGAGAAFVGTVIDNAGISFGAGATLNGRALATGGTITTAGNAISVPGFVPPPPIPTLSQWATILLAALVAGLALIILRRRFVPAV